MTFRTILATGALALLASSASAQDFTRLDQAFDRLDVNHDGVVTRQEFLASRQARFGALDRNRDGVLDQGDFPRLAALIARRAAEASAMVQTFDANGDGRVSYQEFLAGSLAAFDRADANHDGVLTRQEAQAFAQTEREAGARR